MKQTGRSKIAMVTGATGYIGSHLCRRLNTDGWEVHAITRSGYGSEDTLPFLEEVRLHTHDGTSEQLLKIFATTRPDTVFHLAALFLSEHTTSDLDRLLESNLSFGTQIAEAMTATGTYQLINTGTTWQHFENKEYSPVNLYAAMKQAYEAVLGYYVEALGLKVITLKLPDTYGPGDPRPKVLNLLLNAALTDTPLEMSPGGQVLDLIHIEDVVEAFSNAALRLEKLNAGQTETFSLRSDHPMALRDLAGLVEKTVGKKLNIDWGKKPYRKREMMIPPDNVQVLPGWRARHVIGKEMDMLWDIFRNHSRSREEADTGSRCDGRGEEEQMP